MLHVKPSLCLALTAKRECSILICTLSGISVDMSDLLVLGLECTVLHTSLLFFPKIYVVTQLVHPIRLYTYLHYACPDDYGRKAPVHSVSNLH